jgi:FAD/FMN-containing dehydrogenase
MTAIGHSKDASSRAVVVWNGLTAGLPALAFRPGTPSELAAAAAFARDHGLRLRVVMGREDVGAFPIERCLTLDLSDVARP